MPSLVGSVNGAELLTDRGIFALLLKDGPDPISWEDVTVWPQQDRKFRFVHKLPLLMQVGRTPAPGSSRKVHSLTLARHLTETTPVPRSISP